MQAVEFTSPDICAMLRRLIIAAHQARSEAQHARLLRLIAFVAARGA